jgi:hypothetical protein
MLQRTKNAAMQQKTVYQVGFPGTPPVGLPGTVP